MILDITNNSNKLLHTQLKLDFSIFAYNKEKSLGMNFEKNHIILNLTIKTLSSREMGYSEKDSDG